MTSCKPDDKYYKLSNEAKELFLFEVNDTFQLKNEETGEVLTFVILSKKFEDVDDSIPGGMIALGPKADVYIERGVYTFVDSSTNCYQGEVVLSANQEGGFRFYIYLSGCFGNSLYENEYYNTLLSNLNINGTTYYDVYTLEGHQTVLYNKSNGILKIENYIGDNFSIVE